MEWIADPTAWFGLGTLIVLELVLGIDNLIFIAILVEKLPPEQRNRARIVGLTFALLMRLGMLAGISWLQTLTTTLFTLFGVQVTIRGLVLIAGGLFLLVKATTELHARLEGTSVPAKSESARAVVMWQVIAQIIVVDAVFSLDTVITAVGMVDHFAVMVIAVIVAIIAMMVMSGPMTNFVSAHPSVVILCLSFLLTIGFSLFVEGFGLKIPKGYLYSAIAFSIMIETFNQVAQRKQVERAPTTNFRARTAEAVLRLLDGSALSPPRKQNLSSAVKATRSDIFAPAERAMVAGVLSMADRSIRSIMTASADVVWLDSSSDAAELSRKICESGHVAYPICNGRFEALVGVARATDLIRDLIDKGRIDPATVDREPVTFSEEKTVLDLVEQIRGARIPMAIVKTPSGTVSGVVTPTDLLQSILGTQ